MRKIVTALLVLAVIAVGAVWLMDIGGQTGRRDPAATQPGPASTNDLLAFPSVTGRTDPVAGTHRFTYQTSIGRFEIVVAGVGADAAALAARAAFDEAERLGRLLDRRSAGGDVARINRAVANRPVVVAGDTGECLWSAREQHVATGGAFDIAIGRLGDCWRNPAGEPTTPAQAEFRAARAASGMALLEVSLSRGTVTVRKSGVIVDLGSFAGAWALDRMAAELAQRGVTSALLSCDGRVALATAPPPGRTGWPVRLKSPAGDPMPTLLLARQSVSGSGTLASARPVIDPRTGTLAVGKTGAWAIASTATEADALSTAFMVMTVAAVRKHCEARPSVSALLIGAGSDPAAQTHFGPAWRRR